MQPKIMCVLFGIRRLFVQRVSENQAVGKRVKTLRAWLGEINNNR